MWDNLPSFTVHTIKSKQLAMHKATTLHFPVEVLEKQLTTISQVYEPGN